MTPPRTGPQPSAPLTAGALMTRDVASVTAGSPLGVAIRLMLARHVTGLPVLAADGGLAGILTEGDLLRRAELGTDTRRSAWMQFVMGPNRLARDYVGAHSRVVGDIMTTPVHTVDAAAPLAEVAALMENKHVKRVPVLSDQRMVGIISRADLLRALGAALDDLQGDEPPGVPRTDAALRRAVLVELARLSWVPHCGFKVHVNEGVVDLDGIIFAEAEREALKVAASNVPGVSGVVDHLTWVEPNSGMSVPPEG